MFKGGLALTQGRTIIQLFFFFLLLHFVSVFVIICSILLRTTNHQIVDKKNHTKFSLKAFKYEIRFQCHLNPAFSNLALFVNYPL